MILHNIKYCIVKSFSSDIAAVKLKPPSTIREKNSRIADKVRIYVRGGSGGQGSPSSGGLGGKGGSVFIKCVKGGSLAPFTLRQNRRIVAGHGEHYRKNMFNAKPGKDKYVNVPPGTEVRTGDNELMTDLSKPNEVIKIANGGFGGSAKTSFFGTKGERKNIILELKTIADVALTGFPNAGKSSLLRVVSRARPKVGHYPFTTINPMVGSIFYNDSRQITVADLPGLIEDAHLNKGMGHKFLRHIERTKAIVLVVDVDGFQLKEGYKFRSALDTILLLMRELVLYKDILLTRPFILVVNKMDTLTAETNLNQLCREIKSLDKGHVLLRDSVFAEEIQEHVTLLAENNFENVIPVSAKQGLGIELLQKQLYNLLPIDD